MRLPVGAQGLRAKAKEHRVPEEVMDLLGRLPDRVYDGIADVIRGLGQTKL